VRGRPAAAARSRTQATRPGQHVDEWQPDCDRNGGPSPGRSLQATPSCRSAADPALLALADETTANFLLERVE
jgi:hypothetical protein